MTLDDDLDDLLIEPLDEPRTEDAEAAPAAPAPQVDVAAAAAKIKTDLADAKAKAIAAHSLIPAPMPSPLHTVTFPVYDRSSSGFRLITRAFGTPELKTLVKVLLDALLSGDPHAAVEPAYALDATGPLLQRTELFHGERRAAQWECSHSGRIHDTRKLFDSHDRLNHREVSRQLGFIEECVNDMHYNRGGQIRSRVPGHERENAPSGFDRYALDSIHVTPDAWLFYEQHAPFLHWDSPAGAWMIALPTQWNPPPDARKPLPNNWDFKSKKPTVF